LWYARDDPFRPPAATAQRRSENAISFIRSSMFDVGRSKFSRFEENIGLIRYIRAIPASTLPWRAVASAKAATI
jgi:hypothetical protein